MLDAAWAELRFGEVRVASAGAQHVFDVEVHLGTLDPQAVRVELYAEPIASGSSAREEMERLSQPAGSTGNQRYRARVPAARPAADYTVRLIPRRDDVAIPLEATHILWQR